MIFITYWFDLTVLGFNDTSTLLGHFVSSPRESKKRDRRDSRRDKREEQGRKRKGRKRNRNESEETEEVKTFPPLPLPATRIAGLAQHDTLAPPDPAQNVKF